MNYGTQPMLSSTFAPGSISNRSPAGTELCNITQKM